jgi:hypothetical protein
MARGSEFEERATLVAARCSKPLSDSFHGFSAISILDIVPAMGASDFARARPD